MKKKFMIPFSIMVLAIPFTGMVQAKNYTSLQKNNTGEITVIDDILQEEEFQNEIKEYLTKEYGENYVEKIERNQQAVQSANKIDSYFSKTRSGQVIYPDYIGGLYIDDEDTLVIQMVESKIPTEQDLEYSTYQSVLAVDKNSKTEYVKYSYEELQEVHDQILDYFLSDGNNNITGLYIDVIFNRVIVDLNNYTEKEIENFRNSVIDSPIVSFKNTVGFKTISTVNPGAGFRTNKNHGCSYGYRARTSSGQTGVVTAAHCFVDKLDGSIASVGPVTEWQYSGSIDAAFVQNTTGATLTNNLAQKPTTGNITTIGPNVVSTFRVGQKIAKVGQVTGYTTGTVTATSYSAILPTEGLGSATFSDLVKTAMYANDGDSGGIVMELQNEFNFGYNTMGICTAVETNNPNVTLFTKASNINSKFGLSRY